MKKVIIYMILVTVILISGVAVDAKTTKQRQSKTSSSSVVAIADMPEQYSIKKISLLSNGTIKADTKCFKGTYDKIEGGKYYIINVCTNYDYTDSHPNADCGDGCLYYLIIGNSIYYIDGGSEGYEISDFTYNDSNKTIKVNVDPEDVEDWLDHNDYRFTSLEIPLSKFEKIGKVTWFK